MATNIPRLRERFVKNLRSIESITPQSRRDALIAGQNPFAIVLSCSDSRVPSELVFDCGLGDLFVVRVDGNIVAPSIVGSVEFAAATFHSPLVVVMGHTGCGAVAATVSAILEKKPAASPNINDIVERISPAVRELVRPGVNPSDVIPTATRANVRASANHLRHGSRVLEERIAAGKLVVAGAEYALETGASASSEWNDSTVAMQSSSTPPRDSAVVFRLIECAGKGDPLAA